MTDTDKEPTIKNNKGKTDESALYIIGWILIGFFIFIVVLYRLCPAVLKQYLPSCMFLKLTGLYCPGCGGTRAVVALLRGKIFTSFLYHPFVPYTALIGGWFMLSQTIERVTGGRILIGMKYRDIYVWVALVLVTVNFLLKNILVLNGIDVLDYFSYLIF